jgi:hypothetical protein
VFFILNNLLEFNTIRATDGFAFSDGDDDDDDDDNDIIFVNVLFSIIILPLLTTNILFRIKTTPFHLPIQTLLRVRVPVDSWFIRDGFSDSGSSNKRNEMVKLFVSVNVNIACEE